MANISSVLKFFPKASETFEDNLSSSIAAGATIVPVNAATEYDDGDIVCLTVDPGTADEATFTGLKNGSQFENCVWTEGNTGVGHSAGATIVDYISATHLSIISEGIQKEHNDDGTHKHVHADALTVGGVTIEDLLVPTGAIMAFGGGSAPDNWLLCDGAAIDRTTYSALFSAIGTAFGAGDGTTTFNLPNFKGKFPVGRDSGQTEFDTMGESGGEKTHQLNAGEMPSHAHGVNDPGHGHTVAIGGFVQRKIVGSTDGLNGFFEGGVTGTSGSGTGISIQNAGGDGAHNNLQPYQVANYIIKT